MVKDQSSATLCVPYLPLVRICLPPKCDCTNRKRRLTREDHGVTHHGDTFKVTDLRASKIANLTRSDSLLYERAQQAFEKQVKEIEDEFDVVLCDNPDLS